MNIFSKLKSGLSKTRQSVVEKISTITARKKLDAETLDRIEEILIESDLGVDLSMGIVEQLRAKVKSEGVRTDEDVTHLIREILLSRLDTDKFKHPEVAKRPWVTMVVGVNGTGKTTTIGKLTHFYKQSGESLLIGAADTFRAAAVDQNTIWAERAGVPLVSQGMNADPASVAYDTLKSAIALTDSSTVPPTLL